VLILSRVMAPRSPVTPTSDGAYVEFIIVF